LLSGILFPCSPVRFSSIIYLPGQVFFPLYYLELVVYIDFSWTFFLIASHISYPLIFVRDFFLSPFFFYRFGLTLVTLRGPVVGLVPNFLPSSFRHFVSTHLKAGPVIDILPVFRRVNIIPWSNLLEPRDFSLRLNSRSSLTIYIPCVVEISHFLTGACVVYLLCYLGRLCLLSFGPFLSPRGCS